MVNERTYSPPLTVTARINVQTAVAALAAGTGLTETFISRLMNGDGAWVRRLPETSINLRSYDAAMERLSAAWPDDLPWPAEVPRPAPGFLSQEDRELVVSMIAKRRAAAKQAAASEALRRARELAAEAKAARVSIHKPAGGEQAPAQT